MKRKTERQFIVNANRPVLRLALPISLITIRREKMKGKLSNGRLVEIAVMGGDWEFPMYTVGLFVWGGGKKDYSREWRFGGNSHEAHIKYADLCHEYITRKGMVEIDSFSQ
jgi:hypothetical protein